MLARAASGRPCGLLAHALQQRSSAACQPQMRTVCMRLYSLTPVSVTLQIHGTDQQKMLQLSISDAPDIMRRHQRHCFSANQRQAVRAAAKSSSSSPSAGSAQPSWDIKMLYDGDCPLCMREVNMLRRRDAEQGKICFVDIADPDYNADENAGISFEQAMGEIHAVLPDGTVVKNIDVFARLYAAVGLGWMYGFTRIEPLRKAADVVYAQWAKHRLPITGREDMQTILEKRETKRCSLKR